MSKPKLSTALAITLSDADGRLQEQIRRVMPLLRSLFAHLAICASADTAESCLRPFSTAGALIYQESRTAAPEATGIGLSRRTAVSLALESKAEGILYCDGDRALHWADEHPEDLGRTVTMIGGYDLLVMGRTPRAFLSHPRVQRETEAIVNYVFARVTGLSWDVTAAARGLSRAAAAAIVRRSTDNLVSNDVSWPLLLGSLGSFNLGYIETEGLEFETADRCGDEIAKAGGLALWIDQTDANPREWERRLELARVEILALVEHRAIR